MLYVGSCSEGVGYKISPIEMVGLSVCLSIALSLNGASYMRSLVADFDSLGPLYVVLRSARLCRKRKAVLTAVDSLRN